MAKKTGEKYQSIIEAAVKVIARQGYHHAQVARIAREAHVADGTIYLYFENKDDILISLFNEKMGCTIDRIRSQLQNKQHTEEKLRTIVHTHLSQLAADFDLAVVTQIELRQSNPEISKGIGAVLKSYFDLIDQVVADGIAEGLFHRHVDVRLARKMIFGTIDETVTSWVMKQGKYDLVSLGEPILEMLLFGLTGEKEKQ